MQLNLVWQLQKQLSENLLEVIIYKLEEGIFFAKLLCLQNHEEIVEIDSRTSDALALAVRANCRIYTYENVIEAASVFLNDEKRPSKRAIQAQEPTTNTAFENEEDEFDLKKMSLDELNKLLQQVLEQEDYVKAIHIRDEINYRENKS